jgi:hypothetical protein
MVRRSRDISGAAVKLRSRASLFVLGDDFRAGGTHDAESFGSIGYHAV